MAEPVDDSQINPIFLQQLQDALESDNNNAGDQVEDLDLGVDDQLLVDSLRSIISGDNHEPSQQQNWNQVLDGNPDPATLEAVQNALKELGGHEVPTSGGWRRNISEDERDRIRHDNRMRKKRWRDNHASRNRDNDLRGRIARRATVMFGEHSSPQKMAWIEEEFQKRRFMRDTPDSRHGFDDNSLSRLFQTGIGGAHKGQVLHTQISSPRPPAYIIQYRARPSARRPLKLRHVDATAFGAPPQVAQMAKKYVAKPPEKKLGELGERLGLTPLPDSVITKLNLPSAPQDLSKLGPMPPLPKSIIEHQLREKQKKLQSEQQRSENTSVESTPVVEQPPKPQEVPTKPQDNQYQLPEGPSEVTSMPVLHSHASEQTADVLPQAPSHASSNAPSHAPSQEGSVMPSAEVSVVPSQAATPEFDDLDQLDNVLGNALSALQEQEEDDILDPSDAIKQLQEALGQQGIFDNDET